MLSVLRQNYFYSILGFIEKNIFEYWLKSKCINVLPTLLWMVITKHWISSQCQGKNSLIIWKAIESLIRNKARLPKLQLIFGVCFFSSWTLKSCTCLSKLIYQNDLSLFPSISTEQVKRGEVTLLGQNDNEPCWLQKNKKNYILWVTWRLLQSMYLNIFMYRERASYVWAAVCTPVMAVDYYIMLCMFYAIHFTGMIWLDICTD